MPDQPLWKNMRQALLKMKNIVDKYILGYLFNFKTHVRNIDPLLDAFLVERVAAVDICLILQK